jgi:hypothetical protein
MGKLAHPFSDLFKQLGLASSHEAIELFLKTHRPLHANTRLEDDSFWNPGQRHFLKEQLSMDAEWAGLIDQLSLALR